MYLFKHTCTTLRTVMFGMCAQYRERDGNNSMSYKGGGACASDCTRGCTTVQLTFSNQGLIYT